MLRLHLKRNMVQSVHFRSLCGEVLTSFVLLDQDTFEMQSDIILPGHNVIVIDDLIATGKSNHLLILSADG